ncbi:tRNA pseudouridine(13) synthase TruD [Pseudoluteimonas lycopersici]|uniref:tRNA pseudouridine synthase D n=1 Tax=Pseudoluteimonas lycopersici TaxID=1324796 RepID=A0A516V1U4_9GAMM|nr:tRNA pseudouridine(13) synthase TruD [Lysobacter lycopersici]QDQ72499.1 tRNA pseudouridine(13) synthase TruD [Lysobacter lycopersici]
MDASFPRAHGAAVCSATIRASPEDFFVEEIASFEPSGSGEHLLLTVEKRGMNTAFAAKRIAAWAGVAESAIGYAGLKDRHAVTRQRFSVWLPKKIAPDIAALQADDLKVLEHAWHSRKLPRGALAGNRFELLLRDVVGDHAEIDARLETIRARGVPNAFGVQRFGREGGNLDKALAMFAGRRFKREERSLLLSAARSALFNDILARRVAGGSWDRGAEGEVWMLAGSHSVFGPEPLDEALRARVEAFDIHPTGAMWGAGELRSMDEARALEAGVADGFADGRFATGLAKAGLKQERRALRIAVPDLRREWMQADCLRVAFSLPAGSYATAVLHELGEIRDAGG